MTAINYTDLISKHFTFHEALWLPSWNRHATEEDGLNDLVLANLKFVFQKMDLVRDYFGLPIMVHVAYRPKEYNLLVKGALNSAHLSLEPNVAAVDFHIQYIDCDDARKDILKDGKLDQWQMRLEDNGSGASWLHLDTRIPLPGHSRFFKP